MMSLQRHRGVFITGTDTGVGKTLVTAALARCLVERGRNVGVMKPVETGCTQDDTSESDAGRLQSAAGTRDALDLVSPYRFRAPLAPMCAAAQEHRAISLDAIVDAFNALARERDLVLVEGVGGILVPLASGMDVRDLMVRLQLPVVVVGRVALGGINHARLTLEALTSSGVRVMALVLNQTAPSRSSIQEEQQRSTVEWVRAGVAVPVLGPLPYQTGTEERWEKTIAHAAAEPALLGLADMLFA